MPENFNPFQEQISQDQFIQDQRRPWGCPPCPPCHCPRDRWDDRRDDRRDRRDDRRDRRDRNDNWPWR